MFARRGTFVEEEFVPKKPNRLSKQSLVANPIEEVRL